MEPSIVVVDWQRQKRRPASGHPGDDRFFVATEFGGLAYTTTHLQMGIQGLKALEAGDGNQKVPVGTVRRACRVRWPCCRCVAALPRE